MSKDKLAARCEELEAVNDQLITEIHTIHALLMGIGFPGGLKSLKDVAQDILEEKP